MKLPPFVAKILGSTIPPRFWDNSETYFDDSGNFIPDDWSDPSEIAILERQLRGEEPLFPPTQVDSSLVSRALRSAKSGVSNGFNRLRNLFSPSAPNSPFVNPDLDSVARQLSDFSVTNYSTPPRDY